MRGALRWSLPLVVSGLLAAQGVNTPSVGEDLTNLTIDELMTRLPPIGMEWNHEGVVPANWTLVPAAQEFRKRIESGTALTPEQWKHVLISTGVLRLRERWPITEPFVVSLRVPGWLRNTQLRLVPAEPGLAPAQAGFLSSGGPGWCGDSAGRQEQDWRYQGLGDLPLGQQSLAFTLDMERGAPGRSPRVVAQESSAPAPVGVFLTGALSFEVEGVREVDEAVPPQSSLEIDSAVRSSLGVAFRDNWDGTRYPFMIVDPDVLNDSRLAGLGLSLDVDVLRDGAVQETFHLFVSAYEMPVRRSSLHSAREQPFAVHVPSSIPASVEASSAARESWSLRVHGTSEGVCALWYARSRWSGTILVPLDELIQREQDGPHGSGGFWSTPDPELARIRYLSRAGR